MASERAHRDEQVDAAGRLAVVVERAQQAAVPGLPPAGRRAEVPAPPPHPDAAAVCKVIPAAREVVVVHARELLQGRAAVVEEVVEVVDLQGQPAQHVVRLVGRGGRRDVHGRWYQLDHGLPFAGPQPHDDDVWLRWFPLPLVDRDERVRPGVRDATAGADGIVQLLPPRLDLLVAGITRRRVEGVAEPLLDAGALRMAPGLLVRRKGILLPERRVLLGHAPVAGRRREISHGGGFVFYDDLVTGRRCRTPPSAFLLFTGRR